jgi:DNA-binding HxlR family transcriptional regulator
MLMSAAAPKTRLAKTARSYDCAPGCPVEATLDLIGGKWKCVILFHLQDGALRFNVLRRRLTGITQRMLTKQLRELEQVGLITRRVYAEVPPRVEYRLSPLGESMRPVIETLKGWGETYLVQRDAAPATTEVRA